MLYLQKQFFRNIFYLFLPLLLGSLVGLIISSSLDYGPLLKPPLSPPGYIFPIAWSILYLLMGISYFLFKKSNNPDDDESIIYYSQLVVNLLWSIFFFVLKWRLFTILWTILLLGLVIYLLYLFYQKYKPSFYLNIPYLLWLIYATYLTIGVYFLNI